jgi:hypothetical protein
MFSSFSSFPTLPGFSTLLSKKSPPPIPEFIPEPIIEPKLQEEVIKIYDIVFEEYDFKTIKVTNNNIIKLIDNFIDKETEYVFYRLDFTQKNNRNLILNLDKEHILLLIESGSKLKFITDLLNFLLLIKSKIKKDDSEFSNLSYDNRYSIILKDYLHIINYINIIFYKNKKYENLIIGIEYYDLLSKLFFLFKNNELFSYKIILGINYRNHPKLIKISDIDNYLKSILGIDLLNQIKQYDKNNTNQLFITINTIINDAQNKIEEIKKNTELTLYKTEENKKNIEQTSSDINVFEIIYQTYNFTDNKITNNDIIELINYFISKETEYKEKYEYEMYFNKDINLYDTNRIKYNFFNNIKLTITRLTLFLNYIIKEITNNNEQKFLINSIEYSNILNKYLEILKNFNILFYYFKMYNDLIIGLEFYVILKKIINYFKTNNLDNYRKILTINKEKEINFSLENIKKEYDIDLLLEVQNSYIDLSISINKLMQETYNNIKKYIVIGGASKYKKTENKITVIYKKKKYTRVIYICDRKKYIKINKTFMLLSKLKKI